MLVKRRSFLVAAAGAPALVLGARAEIPPAAAREALVKAARFMRSIATEGGYLWRYSLDLKERAGESKATATQIWVQPPGTPSLGAAFLRAHAVTQEPLFLEAARDAADALASGQLASGGWDYLIEFDPVKRAAWFRRADIGSCTAAEAAKRRNISTYDDDTSQSAIRFLLALAEATPGSRDPRDGRARIALDYALQKLIEAQYPNGAWPQRHDGQPCNPADYPVLKATLPVTYPREYGKENYFRHYTLNDHTQRDCILTLLEAWRRTGRQDCLAAAKRGADFLLLAQLPEPQPAWAQQYNAGMEPAWARAFEPPAVCTSESVGVLRLLLDLHLELGEARWLEPHARAFAWFQRSALSPGLWARYYELHTNRPIYGDRDGKIHHRLEDISEERQRGYSWRGDYGVAGAIAAFDELKGLGREAVRARAVPKPLTAAQRESRRRKLEPQTQAVINSLDAEGRWVTKAAARKSSSVPGDRVETSVFLRNLEVLCDYLEAAK